MSQKKIWEKKNKNILVSNSVFYWTWNAFKLFKSKDGKKLNKFKEKIWQFLNPSFIPNCAGILPTKFLRRWRCGWTCVIHCRRFCWTVLRGFRLQLLKMFHGGNKVRVSSLPLVFPVWFSPKVQKHLRNSSCYFTPLSLIVLRNT